MPKLAEAKCRATELGWLARQPPDFRDRVLDRCEFRTFEPGDKFFGLDDPVGGMFGLTEGFVDVLLAAGPFPPFLAFIGRPVWWIGEAAVVTGTPRRTQVVARTEACALYLPTVQIEMLAVEDPTFWRRLAEMTVSHLDNALLFAATVASRDLRERILATLLRLSGESHRRDETIDLPCLQSEIAEMAGLSRNSVGPVIRLLAREGLVQLARNKISYNPVRLQEALGA